jgi:hypothetical protein
MYIAFIKLIVKRINLDLIYYYDYYVNKHLLVYSFHFENLWDIHSESLNQTLDRQNYILYNW